MTGERDGSDSVNDIVYAVEPALATEEFQDILTRSTLGERRPLDDASRLTAMLRNADIVATARHAGKLVGISRALTDFSYCCYLADLAVDQVWQGRGIGKCLIAKTHRAAGPQTKLILTAAPAAESYYPHIGMTKHNSCWTLPFEQLKTI
jgi:GNAT superfamily N-acetyltransferase